MSSVKSVLFVCTGNSCRSVMAEGLLRAELNKRGKGHIKVDSAGVMSAPGMPPTAETVQTMKEEGIDVSYSKAKLITPEMIRNSDLVLVMEAGHKEEVLNRAPDAWSKTFLLKEYGRPAKWTFASKGITDPIGRSVEDYRAILNEIREEVERIAELL